MNFTTDREPPTGELYVKGNSVFKGYFKRPELTKQVLSEDGWLKLGDIAILKKNGAFQLIDRMKEMVKLQNGQFISPQKLETIYMQAPIINQIYVDINSNHEFLVAIVHLNEEKLKQFAFVNNFKEDLADLLNLKDVEIGVLKQLERMANTNKLSEVEKIRRILIIDQPFTAQAGLLTSSQKMKRHAIKEAYQKELQEIYSQESRKGRKIHFDTQDTSL